MYIFAFEQNDQINFKLNRNNKSETESERGREGEWESKNCLVPKLNYSNELLTFNR